MARYEAGETLASIARTYDCSPPAISYVVSRSRQRHPEAEAPAKPAAAAEPQLIKAAGIEGAPNGALKPVVPKTDSAPPAPAEADHARGHEGGHAGGNGEANGFARNGAADREPHPPTNPHQPAAAPLPLPLASEHLPGLAPGHSNGNGAQRRTLHLSLGTPGNGATHGCERHATAHPIAPAMPHNGDGAPANHQATPPSPAPVLHATPEPRGFEAAYPQPMRRPDADGMPHRDAAGSFIDKDLRARVDGDIAAFLAAFDAALVQDTQESRAALREATDRLLRAGARTRIELERLEARTPLPPRDAIGRGEPAWRSR